MNTVTRFAPSPTGYLHLGHAYAALFADAKAKEAGGRLLLRIEDIDPGRSRPEFEAAIIEDLKWLGLSWEEPVRRQSEHIGDHRSALMVLEDRGLVYPCFCTRKEIRAEIENSGRAPHGTPSGAPAGPDGPIYPGTCRSLSPEERRRSADEGRPYALRLDMARAAALAAANAGPLTWTDRERGTVFATPEIFGDVVLARKDTPTSYHLAVTVDDHMQGVTLVTRGDDLFAATHVHRLLQELLRLETPDYHHHRMLTTETGERLAKRDQEAGRTGGPTGKQQETGTGTARTGKQRPLTIRSLREAGKTPADVREMAGFETP